MGGTLSDPKLENLFQSQHATEREPDITIFVDPQPCTIPKHTDPTWNKIKIIVYLNIIKKFKKLVALD